MVNWQNNDTYTLISCSAVLFSDTVSVGGDYVSMELQPLMGPLSVSQMIYMNEYGAMVNDTDRGK